ncbi:hypothetical protein PPERSA_02597 [Pseudocohnilembus persalinus]|uniref:Armadillo-type fold n=1 Tax=Pseudocohnilembus persalinus TaxID=266149 RepID=A0A0V0R5E7_PSEPJ|nr:hypothetical protein PPERSA_02597 [Pseudocohnilembus persalinus]|eukprot:KRX09725.1 hypothetical protein PPERSA_02597 [Pseudocohnilembus persalinus]
MIIEILVEKENIQSFSRPNRLLLIKDFYEKLKVSEWGGDKLNELGEFISQFLPELVVGLRDSNKKCRKIAKEIFNLIGKKMEDLGLLKDFVSSVAAGLAGETSLMKANSIAAKELL